jgi:hypothetical protein
MILSPERMRLRSRSMFEGRSELIFEYGEFRILRIAANIDMQLRRKVGAHIDLGVIAIQMKSDDVRLTKATENFRILHSLVSQSMNH